MHKDTRWARALITMQDEEGKWGNFHSLSSGSGLPVTTEQALRRLEILGYTAEDDCIRKALSYMHDCLSGKKQLPDRREKLHDWDIFTSMILSAWIRRFTKEDPLANAAAENWAKVITAAFVSGGFDRQAYEAAFHDALFLKPKGGRLTDPCHFYLVSLMRDMLDPQIEAAFVRYILDHPQGIYYIWEKPLRTLPDFCSLAASRYLGAVELLAGYEQGREELRFAADWLLSHRRPDGSWDMGPGAKGGVYFPLSDSWRRAEDRIADCTGRIDRMLTKILSQNVEKD